MKPTRPGRAVRWVALPLLGGLVVAGVAGQLVRRELSVRFGPRGTLVDIGGYRLHLHCTGSGPVTVLLEAGLNEFSVHWRPVQAALSSHARVCSYDRAGLGWSDPSPRPATVINAVVARCFPLEGTER